MLAWPNSKRCCWPRTPHTHIHIQCLGDAPVFSFISLYSPLQFYYYFYCFSPSLPALSFPFSLSLCFSISADFDFPGNVAEFVVVVVPCCCLVDKCCKLREPRTRSCSWSWASKILFLRCTCCRQGQRDVCVINKAKALRLRALACATDTGSHSQTHTHWQTHTRIVNQ